MAIKLKLRAAFESMLRGFGGKKDDEEKDDPTSIVLFLRNEEFPTLEQMSVSAQRAFGVPFATENAADYCVFEKTLFTQMQVGPHVLSFLFYSKPYFGEVNSEFVDRLPHAAQRTAWKEHTAWMGVNYAKGPADERVQYAILSRLCCEMVDGNCAGVFLPGGPAFIPHGDALLPALKRWGASVPELDLRVKRADGDSE